MHDNKMTECLYFFPVYNSVPTWSWFWFNGNTIEFKLFQISTMMLTKAQGKILETYWWGNDVRQKFVKEWMRGGKNNWDWGMNTTCSQREWRSRRDGRQWARNWSNSLSCEFKPICSNSNILFTCNELLYNVFFRSTTFQRILLLG